MTGCPQSKVHACLAVDVCAAAACFHNGQTAGKQHKSSSTATSLTKEYHGGDTATERGGGGETEREGGRQRGRQTERERERDRQTDRQRGDNCTGKEERERATYFLRPVNQDGNFTAKMEGRGR